MKDKNINIVFIENYLKTRYYIITITIIMNKPLLNIFYIEYSNGNKKLEPIEQAIFVLREMFNVEYEDLQLIFDKKADNCRKIVSRAKLKLKDAELKDLTISFPQLDILESIKKVSLTRFFPSCSLGKNFPWSKVKGSPRCLGVGTANTSRRPD